MQSRIIFICVDSFLRLAPVKFICYVLESITNLHVGIGALHRPLLLMQTVRLH